MRYDELKNKLRILIKEELDYLNNIVNLSNEKLLTELEKLTIYRKLNYYNKEINNLIKEIKIEAYKIKQEIYEKDNGIILEINLDKDYLKILDNREKLYLFNLLGIDIDTLKYQLKYKTNGQYPIDSSMLLINQDFYDKYPYLYCGIYDDSDSFLSVHEVGVYYSLYTSYPIEDMVEKNKIKDYLQDKIIINIDNRVDEKEVFKIYKNSLLNENNHSFNDCINETINKMHELNNIRDPKYKEKLLLDRINELYHDVKGEFINEESLYNGNFIELFKEIYKLPNEKIVEKERIVKNNGKSGVIVIGIVKPQDKYSTSKEFILTVQERIKDKLIVEFPAGFIEEGETPVEAAKRELLEETGYTTDDIFLLDEAYTSPGIGNSTNYIVVANNCVKVDRERLDSTEYVTYGLFNEQELKYIIDHNIMSGAMNKLAYYTFINNVNGVNYLDNEAISIDDKLSLKKKKNPFKKY